jgi:general secretion pathway protein C
MKLTLSLSLLKRLLTLIVASYCAWQFSTLLWLFVPVQSDAAIIRPNIQSMSQVKPSTINMNQIVALNLFGSVVQNNLQSVDKQKLITAPETSLNLKLRGLRKGQGKMKSSAIIENDQRVQNIYHLGDAIEGQNKVIIYEIYSQRLILQRAGKFETLTLFEVLQQKNNSAIEEKKLEKEIEPAKARVPVIDKTTSKKLTESLSTIVDTLKSSPMSLNGTMIIEPSENDGVFQGYRVAPGSDKVLFARLGLLKGDIITQVNDVELTSSGKIMSLMGELSSVSELEIKVLRRGQPLAFRYSVK